MYVRYIAVDTLMYWKGVIQDSRLHVLNVTPINYQGNL